jgi:hypothetical protein
LRRHGHRGLGDATVGEHQDPVGALGVGHELWLQCNGNPRCTGRRISQQPVASLAGLQRFQRPDCQHRTAQVAAGAGGTAHLLADDRSLGERGTRAAELLGHLEPHPPCP